MGRLQFRQLWLLMVSALLSQGSSQQSAESTSNSGNTVSEKSRLAMTPALIRAGDGFDLTLSGLILVGLTHLKRCQRGDKAVEWKSKQQSLLTVSRSLVTSIIHACMHTYNTHIHFASPRPHKLRAQSFIYRRLALQQVTHCTHYEKYMLCMLYWNSHKVAIPYGRMP